MGSSRLLVVFSMLLVIVGGLLRVLDEDGASNAEFGLLVAACVVFILAIFLGGNARPRR